jgi:capsular exopolysaccharide synthesis family protein
MSNLLRNDVGAGDRPVLPGAAAAAGGPTLLQVLWHGRWLVVASLLVCLALAAAYLANATPIYRAQTQIYVEAASVNPFAENANPVPQSENYLNSQAEVVQSAPVLQRALDAVGYRELKTFASARGDAVNWLVQGGALKVEAAKRSDIILLSMDSAFPQEAVTFVQAVAEAYLWQRAHDRQSAGDSAAAVLLAQRKQFDAQLQALQGQMLALQQETGVISFRDDKGNIGLERTASLASQLTTADVAVWELSGRVASAEAAMASPDAISAFVESQQLKGKDSGDREFDELRSELMQHNLALATSLGVQGANSKRVQILQGAIADLHAKIAEKERSIAQAFLTDLSMQLAAAKEKQRQVREAFDAQQKRSQDLNPKAQEFVKIGAEHDRVQKQIELLDAKIAAVHVNSGPGPEGARILAPADLDEKPVRPRRNLTLAAAGLLGCLLGLGLSLLRESQGSRLRSPEEVISYLGLPVVATVPKISTRFSPVARGQMVYLDARSPVAEAYRSVRTSLNLGSAQTARTLLIASPMPGDGKSTTASNLAIAFAEAGQRTLLIDCDLREPVQHLIFGIDGLAGVSSVIAAEADLASAVRATRVPGLYLLPCGPVPANPAEMLASKRFGQMMQALLGQFDRIVLDSPPIVSVTDARILGASADATLLVLRMGRSMRKTGVLALDGLERVRANVIGAIANDMPTPGGGYYGGSWQYAGRSRKQLGSRTVRALDRPANLGHGAAVRSGNGHGGNGSGNGNGGVAGDSRTAARATDRKTGPADLKWSPEPDTSLGERATEEKTGNP